jgi:murein DD-endopeptidase MepM/ murein hydrolase activator NlpD
MQRGITVVAAAPGVVKAVRDGMQDASVRTTGHAAIKGREAGNGVVIEHGNGWESQYSHLKRDSILVEPGERVSTGQPLGQIGLSGNTEFPHVEFAVRHDGRPVDPFVGITAGSLACGGERRPLWSAAALAQLPYRASGPLSAGFATQRPEAEAARHGAYAETRLPGNVPSLVFWADVWGAMKGDVQRIHIDGPDGRPVHRAETVLNESTISWFAFSGLRRPAAGWQPGAYTGTYELLRDSRPVVTITETVEIAGG